MQRYAKVSHGFRSVAEPVITIVLIIGFFAVFAVPMGIVNMMNTLMNTAFDLLMNTVFYIMAIAVIAGALSGLMTEFGVCALLNRLLSPLMKPLFGMPGVAALGIVTTYISDNPAILALAEDKRYCSYFKAYQIPALTNLGTSFRMGLIVTTFMLGLSGMLGKGAALAVLCGNLGAVAGSIVSTRLMLRFTAKALGKEAPVVLEAPEAEQKAKEQKGGMLRVIDALMHGGKAGVEVGLAIIPGVLVFCTIVMMLTNGASADGTYTGTAYEGIALLPKLAARFQGILKPLFGFTSAEGIAVPITALGAAGAAMGVVSKLVSVGMAGCVDIAVFTAMCMCWSGYLSTHVSMMDVLGCSRFTGKAILSHTVGGLFAGVFAHWLFVLLQMIF